MNSSSSPPPPSAAPALKDKYDVFLSFKVEDTRFGFTSHLHAALLRKQIETYIDDERLEKGDDIEPSLLKAIERSKIALVIFSKNYASSTWCLKELVHILECKKRNEQIVIPIFYGVDPSQKGTYALDEDRPFKRSRDEVANSRAALEEAATISGFHYKTGTEADFVEEVVQDVLTKLNRNSSSDLKGLVGIEKKIEKIESLLCLDSPGVCCVGIWGMGGIGKTTLADAVFHRQSSKFEAACFLANVRENSEQTNGLNQLRNKLVREILKDQDINIDTQSIPDHIQGRLRRTKALIVLDDGNARKQLEDLVGDHDWFCPGSRIIITTRDKGLLEQKDGVNIFNVEGLGSDDALRLFHSHGNKSPTTDNNTDLSREVVDELSREVVDYIKGNPLALKVMGALFRRCKSKQEWEVQWNKLKQDPIDGEIEEVLRISYDGLRKNEKEIFLDIACFHKGYDRNYVKELLDSRGFHGEAGIKDLIDRSLISISDSYNWVDMHDLVQEMGRAIVREQRIEERSRLFNAEEYVYQVLTNNQRDGRVEAISFDFEELDLQLEHANFEKMYQLRCLRVHVEEYPLIVSLDLPNSLRCLEWNKYPLKSLPSKFSAQNLLVLSMPYSKVGAQLWNEDQSPQNLKWINLRYSTQLTEVPNLSQSLKIEHIDMHGCRRLVEIPSYFQRLGKLTYLDLGYCINLQNLPEMPCNLEFLDLSWTAIEKLPSSVWSHEKISHLDIKYCKHLKSLPSNSCKLKLSDSFILSGCASLCEFWELPTIIRGLDLTEISKNLVSLPTNIWKLKSLKSLSLSYCSKFQNFPEISEAMEHPESLRLSGTAVKELPPSIGNLVKLQNLDLSDCEKLVSLPTNIWKLKYLERLNLSRCSKFQNFPEISEAMEQLKFLKLSGAAVKELPPSIENLVALRKLDLSKCKNLEVVPDPLFCLTSLQELNLSWTEIKSIPASIKQAAQLSDLCLIFCKSLESLPELPPLLQCLDAHGCTSLKTVSSSSTAITQGWKEYIFSRWLREEHIFSDCPKLDENARSNILADAQLRIMRMATATSKYKEAKMKISAYHSDDDYESDLYKGLFCGTPLVAIRCLGYEIPKWISHQSEGSSIKIELPRDWFSTDFLGFALSLAYKCYAELRLRIGCKYNFKTSNGESHKFDRVLAQVSGSPEGYSLEVFVSWYNVFEEVVEKARSPTAFYNRFTEVNVDFMCDMFFGNVDRNPLPVHKCGICLLYGKDAEMIKHRSLYALQFLTPQSTKEEQKTFQ